MTDKELLQEALNQLEHYETKPEFNSNINKTIAALRARLAPPEQDQMPTKIMGPNLEEVLNAAGFYKQREWVGLTDEEAAQCWTIKSVQTWKNIEAKLKEKNNG